MHVYSYLCGALLFVNYHALSYALQYIFYHKRRNEVKPWKIQPTKTITITDKSNSISAWRPPGVLSFFNSPKPDRHPYHGLFGPINLIVASCIAAFICEWTIQGKSSIITSIPIHLTSFDGSDDGSLLSILRAFALSIAWELFVEYYWHRLMHLPWFYQNFHKIHHYYKSPEPWDDLSIHPLEGFGYYCILFAPALLIRQHVAAFILYMAIMGVTGITDHSGIKMSFGSIYNTEDHDLHHEKFNVNYGFPVPWFDILHGTFHGTYLGKSYTIKGSKQSASGPGRPEQNSPKSQ